MIIFQNIARMIAIAATDAALEHSQLCVRCIELGVSDCPAGLDLIRLAVGSSRYAPIISANLCEWDPERNSPATLDELGTRTSSCSNLARYEFGDKVTFRVCSACALLHRFAGRAKRSISPEIP